MTELVTATLFLFELHVMDAPPERRGHPRLAISLPLHCTLAEAGERAAGVAVTRNIGSGGLYFETDCDGFSPGCIAELELIVPPGEGHFSYAGQVRGIGEVLRVDALSGDVEAAGTNGRRFGVAARFSEPLKLLFRNP